MSVEIINKEFETVLENVGSEQLIQSMGLLLGVIGFFLILAAVIKLIQLVCRWKIFTKAGDKGWKALIPFYSTYTEYTLTWSGVYGLAMMAAMMISAYCTSTFATDNILYTIGAFIGLFGTAVSLYQVHKLSKAFGHGFGFTLGLLFLNPIFLMVLAFGKSEYVGPAKKLSEF